MYVAYVLRNPEGRLYIGHTDDLARRIEEHLNGDSRWTSTRGPWGLVFQETFLTRPDAMRRERALKSGRLNQRLRASIALAQFVERVLPRKD